MAESYKTMKKAIKYSIILCVVSWVYAAIMIFGLDVKNPSDNPMKYTIYASLYMLLPMIVAMVLQMINKEKLTSTGLLRFKIRWSWLVAWILPVVIVLLTIFVNTLLPGCEFNTEMSAMIPADSVPEEQKEMVSMLMTPAFLIVTTIISGLFAGATINALFAFGEEYGWRNYLIAALRDKKFACASIFIGIVWGLWHFPLILLGHNYPQHSVAGVFMMVIFCVLLSFIETYFVLKAKSVYPAAIFHGAINAVAGLNVLLIKGGNDLINGASGLSGFIVMAVVIAIIYVFDRYVLKDNIFSKTIGEVLDNVER
jgi:membrane protease YdiL (CAAX protease family)